MAFFFLESNRYGKVRYTVLYFVLSNSCEIIVNSGAVTICILNLVFSVEDRQRVDADPDPTFYVIKPNPDPVPDATLKVNN